jgi:hypothetical protein
MVDKVDGTPVVTLDEDGKKLQLEAEKAKYVEAIATAPPRGWWHASESLAAS